MYIDIHCQKVPLCCIFTEKFPFEFKIYQNVIKIPFSLKIQHKEIFSLWQVLNPHVTLAILMGSL